MTAALDAYNAAMATADAAYRAVFDAALDAYNAASVASYLAYDLAYQTETAEGQA